MGRPATDGSGRRGPHGRRPASGSRERRGWRAALLGLLAAGLLGLVPAAPALAEPGPSRPDRLLAGEALHVDESICSPGGALYCLIQQGDGNLVLYKPNQRPLWANARVGPARITIMQGDGNLVSYTTAGVPVWETRTWGMGPSTLYLQGDGTLVIRRDVDGAVTWTSGTTQQVPPVQPATVTDRLQPGEGLFRGGRFLQSQNGRFTAYVDRYYGHLLLSTGGVMYWHTPLCPDDDWLEVSPQGALHLDRSDGADMWWTWRPSRYSTRPPGASTLILQNSGDLQLVRISDGVVIWHSNTALG